MEEGTRIVEPAPEQPVLLASEDVVSHVCCGLDEVGRGALAGPLVAAGVILPEGFAECLGRLSRFLRDSKTVPPARRVELAALVRQHALAVELVVIPVELINARGIGWANREAFYQLITRITADEYIVDGRVRPHAPPERSHQVRCMVRADARVPAVSAASLVAKAYRDALMCQLHTTYPQFGWDANVGYGTPAHLAALRLHGPSPLHRSVFVATALNGGQKARKDTQAVALMPDLDEDDIMAEEEMPD